MAESKTVASAAETGLPEAPAAPRGLQSTAQEVGDKFDAVFGDIDEGMPGDDHEPVAEAEPESAEGSPAAGEPEVSEEYERALLALRYSGVPDSIIKNASQEELIAWGTEAANRRAKTEAALEERATRIRELEEGKKAPAEPAKPAPADWAPHLKVLADKLGLSPEDAKAAFGPMLDAVAQQARTEIEGRLSKTEQVTQEAAAAEGRRQISEQVRRLSADHPKLKTDQDLVQKLNGKALALWKSGEYRDAESVYDDAARIVLGNPSPNLAAKRRNGSAPPPEGRVEDRTMSPDEAFLTAMDRIEAGDQRGARRAGSQVSWSRRRTDHK